MRGDYGALLAAKTKAGTGAALHWRLRATLKIAAFLLRIEAMRPEGLRKSDRISFRMPVEASWFAAGGVAVKHSGQTLLVSRNGGVLCLAEKMLPGQEMTLRRQNGDDWKMARARVLAEFDRDAEGFLYAFVLLEPRDDFWGIDFPALHTAEEALARLLMECSFCQRREVVYLNELQLKSFEVRKCVARLCTHCDAPSIWIEALSTTRQEGITPKQPEEKVNPHRKKNRVKARVLACIRRRGFQEEVAVCEDLSKGGLSFRSRNQYPEGTRAEVAVPFTPGAGAIFVPIRIVFSQALPTVGLYRHGAAYVKPPTDGA
jgi:PilZ domain